MQKKSGLQQGNKSKPNGRRKKKKNRNKFHSKTARNKDKEENYKSSQKIK